MMTEKQTILKVISQLLDYPHPDYFKELAELEDFIRLMAVTPPVNLLKKSIAMLKSKTLNELQELYVSLFDFRESTCLYLTSHEHGDGRDRGKALVELRQLLRQGGYEELGGELPDSIPLLLEFLAVKPMELEVSSLEQRLSIVVSKIKEKTNEESPYHHIFASAESVLPKDTGQRMDLIERKREKADLDELPYPLYYEH